MKFVIIAALGALFAILIYSRLYPYIQAFKKVLNTAKTFTEPEPDSSRNTAGKIESKLVRCVGCGTWIPSDRAIMVGSGHSNYCSRECLEKTDVGGNRKVAG